MAIEWAEKRDPLKAISSEWTLEKIADFKRSLSVRMGSRRKKERISQIETQDMARLWDVIDLVDRRIRERDERIPPGPRPEWVRRAIDHRP